VLFVPPYSLGKGGAAAPPPSGDPALPTYPGAANNRYWFVANNGAYVDTAGTIRAGENDPVAMWKNNGLAEDAKQSAALNRPILRKGGLNGHDYLDCSSVDQHFFEDLLEGSQPSGITGFSPFTAIMVVDQVGTGGNHTIFGSPNSGSATIWKNVVQFQGASNTLFWFKPQVSMVPPNVGGANVLAVRKDSGAAGGFAKGSHAANASTFTQNTNANSSSSGAMKFLRSGSTPGSYFLGRLYEVIWFNAALGTGDINTIMTDLKTKYAIT
jgi:hypothetical protein